MKILIHTLLIATVSTMCILNSCSNEDISTLTYFWNQAETSYKTYDGSYLSTITEASWIITDVESFKIAIKEPIRANIRLNDFIPPVMRTAIISNKKDDLINHDTKSISEKHTEKMIKSLNKLTFPFGIKVTSLTIRTTDV